MESKKKTTKKLPDYFYITGTKSELLEAEKVLQENGYKSDEEWNSTFREDEDFIYIVCYGGKKYGYYNHDGLVKEYSLKKLLK